MLGLDTPSPDLPELSEPEILSFDLQTKGVSETGLHPLDAHQARLRDLGCQALGA
ncbi:hypothetical protein GCM10008955_37140 [Deinococcus malanensis]|uniref:Uncharacterized protein n=1 Tax=Deinococcus malanensis TaxID=1706855 RepID=A0ABQ2F433_9DEIO|nr:hypothetical protein GCM10008955_37140 [Deinococcus malanensis]